MFRTGVVLEEVKCFDDHAVSILSPVRSPSPDTKKALEALAAVERLQSQLL